MRLPFISQVSRRKIALIASAAVVLVAGTAVALILSRETITGSTPKERVASIRQAADDRPSGAANAVAREAKHPDPSVRRAAMFGLGRFVAPEYRPIVEAGTKDTAPGVRSAAARTLGLYQDESAADRLGELLTGDAHEQVRLSAVAGLGQNTTPKATVLLVEAAEKNDNPTVQLRAMEALLEKYNIHFIQQVDPKNRAHWSNLVEHVKRYKQVRDAYQHINRPLSLPPEHRPKVPPE